jgi:predicted permease
VLQDVRYAIRWFWHNPAFTLLAATSLALGIGFNTSLFSITDAVLFRPLPVDAPGELVDVYTSGSDGDTYATTSNPDLQDLRARNDVFVDMIGYSPMFAALNLADRSRLALGEVVTGNYFQVLGVRPSIGRALLPDDDRPGAERVAVISHRMWRRDYAGSSAAIGQSLRMRGKAYTIVGVAPIGFSGMVPMLAPELWIPLAHVGEVEPAGIQDAVPSPTGTTRLDRRGQRWMFVKGRLRDGATIDAARANLQLLMAQMTAAHPQTNKERGIAVVATRDVRIHPDADRMLKPIGLGLMVAVGLVLVIACANVASMLLARAAGRRREVSIRLALGAQRGRLVRQLLTESVVLSALGAAGGVAMAWLLTRVVTTLELPIPIPIALDLRIDYRVLAFATAVSLLAGISAGLAPALRSANAGLLRAMRPDDLSADVAGRRWTLRDGLVAAQIAVTCVLLVGAGLLTRSLVAAQHADPGFRVSGIAIVSADAAMAGYDTRERSERFWERALERAKGLPGVQSAALAARLPFSINYNQESFYIPGIHSPADRAVPILNSRVSAEYFDTLGVPILQGRRFTASDTPQSPLVIIVSESLAAKYWPGQSPLGRRMHLRGPDGPSFEIVGVAGDHKVRTIGEAPQPYAYFATSQQRNNFQVLMARTSGDAGALLTEMRRELLALEPNLVFLDNQTMEDQVAATLLPARAGAWIVSTVGVVAMALAAIGLYGVIAYSVARRTREIGVRLALGARPSRVLALIVRQGLTVVAIGLVLGSVLAAWAARAIAGMLYGVTSSDPVAWLAATATIVVVSLSANLVPAFRAARVAPSVALRAE